MEKIKVKDEEVLSFYDELGSKHFQLQGKILERIVNLQLDIYFKSVGFVSGVLGILGVIAGFGFTALTFVQNKFIFFLGEVLLIYAILRGIKWIQGVYNNEHESLRSANEKYNTFFEERNNLFMIVYNQLISAPHEIEKTDLQNLLNKDQESLSLFKPEKKDNLPIAIYSKEVYLCFIVGTVMLLLSFFYNDLLYFLFHLLN